MAASVFVILTLLSVAGDSFSYNRSNVYVSQLGSDSRSCGSPRTPCKSIAHAVRQVDWGGHMYIDGTGTDKDPFGCDSDIAHARNPGIFINKSVIMKGFQSTPHVLCIHGINFHKSSEEQRTLNVILSQISFMLTPIVFEDCSHVEISNCSLQGASTAASVHLRNLSTSFLLSIQSSQFQNNSQCIELLLFANNVNQYGFITINVVETTFLENGVYGILTIRASDEKNPSTLGNIQVNISFYKVRSRKNRGLFVSLDLQTAVTNETYRDVLLQDNVLTRRSGSNTNRHSLYTSQAKETRVNFLDFSCINNRLHVRCLKIRSQQAQVIIRNSSFVGQSVGYMNGAALSLESKIRASLVISNSKFKKNAGNEGGAVYAYSAYGTLALNFTNVNFTRCSARRHGCAVLVGKPAKRGGCEYSQARYELTARFRKVKVTGSNGEIGKCTCIQLFLNNGTVEVDKSAWLRNVRATNGALSIQTTGGRARVTISGSKFIENSVSTGSAVTLLALKEAAGSLTVINSSFLNSEVKGKRALMISPKYRIKLVKVSITHFCYGLQVHTGCAWNKVFPANLIVDSCNFTNNKNDINIMLRDPASVRFTVKGTIFAGQQRPERSYAIRFHVRPLKRINVSSADIELDNVLFDSKPSSNFALFFQGNKRLKIRSSVFRNGISLHPEDWRFQKKTEVDYITGTGGVSLLTVPDKPQNPGCVQAGDHNNTHPLWDYDSHVVIEDSTFQENAGLVAGAIYISNGNATFERCTFIDNFAIQRAGHAYFAYGTGRVEFVDCLFEKTRKGLTMNNTAFNKSTFLYSETGGPITLVNTSMYSFGVERAAHTALEISNGGYVEIDQRSTIQCSPGSRLLFERTTHFAYTEKNSTFCWINITGLKYSCRMCSPGFYSLQRGISRGLYPNETFHCLQCPFGASCIESNIAAKPNFWGYQVSQHPPTLRFISCPENYCRSPTSDSLYNSCQGNRSGTLCGACATGFTETLFSAECQKATECKNYWVWLLMILFTAGFTFYMLKKPPIVGSLGRHILWFRTNSESNMMEDLGQVHSHSDDGYIKIIFYFYQAAELVMIGSLENLIHYKIPVIRVLLAAFNFSILAVDRRIGCPFAGLTAVTKELFLCLPVFCTMAMICLFYCIHSVTNLLRGKEKPALIDYMAVFIEILLLGYERLAETSLKLIHCVTIGSEKRLFLDGNIHCWQWWQYLVLLYTLVFVIPFILVLYWGSFMLHSSSISTRGFLGACVLPLPFLLFWSFKSIFQKRAGVTAQQSNEDVLKVFHGAFRPPSDKDPGTLYWESVLIGRRFILLTFQAFVTNPMLRMVGITGACVLMTLHHFAKKPYRSPLANKAETLSLITLVIMAIINHTKATLVSFGVTSEGPNQSYLEAFEWFEVCALALIPTLLFTLAVFAILSQLVRLLVFVIKQILRWADHLYTFHWCQSAKSTPLLEAATPNYGTHSFHDD